MRGGKTVDPARFNDPLANTTEWTPLAPGGTSLCTHKLRRVLSTRLEFRTSVGAKVVGLVLLAAGLGMVVLWVLAIAGAASRGEGPLVVLLSGGLVFGGSGVFLLHHFTRPIVFDKASGYFWKGRREPPRGSPSGKVNHYTRLQDIHAIQLLAEHCESSGEDDSSYTSYELNLVLADGTRVNVIDHGNRTRVLEDAQALAAFLGVRVWDASYCQVHK